MDEFLVEVEQKEGEANLEEVVADVSYNVFHNLKRYVDALPKEM